MSSIFNQQSPAEIVVNQISPTELEIVIYTGAAHQQYLAAREEVTVDDALAPRYRVARGHGQFQYALVRSQIHQSPQQLHRFSSQRTSILAALRQLHQRFPKVTTPQQHRSSSRTYLQKQSPHASGQVRAQIRHDNTVLTEGYYAYNPQVNRRSHVYNSIIQRILMKQ